ncbi:unnamed protein product [Microthlaspi erraticum]|uniref:Uncharacterized protein n=1 Tax=Microthlaspi erraticum TaxID=1685480 RepID=A0A6D2HY49_9BRAS|nr:unnamed protein product [Microthlaspi erraticum]
MVTATRRGLIRPSQDRSETHRRIRLYAGPNRRTNPQTTIQDPPPPIITMIDEAVNGGAVPSMEMVLFEGVVEAESFATAEDEPMADEEATAEKPEEPEIPRECTDDGADPKLPKP